jgi:hypothetical protein
MRTHLLVTLTSPSTLQTLSPTPLAPAITHNNVNHRPSSHMRTHQHSSQVHATTAEFAYANSTTFITANHHHLRHHTNGSNCSNQNGYTRAVLTSFSETKREQVLESSYTLTPLTASLSKQNPATLRPYKADTHLFKYGSNSREANNSMTELHQLVVTFTRP